MALQALSTRLSRVLLNSSDVFCSALAVRSCSSQSPNQGERNPKRRDRVFLNEVRLIGRVGKNPELRGSNTSPVATFPMVTATFYQKDGEEKERNEWHRILVGLPFMRDRIMKTVVKGDRVMVIGSLRYSAFTDSAGKRINMAFIGAARVLNLTNKFLNNQESSSMYEEDFGEEEDDADTEQNRYDDNEPDKQEHKVQ